MTTQHTKTETAQHSPLPWKAIEGRIISDARYVATVDDWSNPDCAEQYRDINAALKAESEANAAMIALAVNNHARLTEENARLRRALEAAVERMEAVSVGIPVENRHEGVSQATHVRHMAGHLAQHAKLARTALEQTK
jgi:hypothetical protein